MFHDRFTYNNPALAALNLETATEAQIALVSPALIELVGMVRRHSVLIRKKTVFEIYNAITQHADPRIALVLAAARDKEGNQLFPDLSIVQNFMFGQVSSTITEANVTFFQKDIFVDGIKRVTAALAAATIIAQLAQIDEQAKHAIVLEKQALDDLDRILQVPELVKTTTTTSTDTSLDNVVAIWFKSFSGAIAVGATLTARVYLSSLSGAGWITFGTYTSTIDTAKIAIDLADLVNQNTLSSKSGNIIAASILAGGNQLHRVEFTARARDVVNSSDVISVQFLYTDSAGVVTLPFDWGVEKLILTNAPVNSVFVNIQKGTLTSSATAAKTSNQYAELNVIYIRRSKALTNYDDDVLPIVSSHPVEYRVTPSKLPESIETTMPVLTSVNPDLARRYNGDRHSQLGLLLIDDLYRLKQEWMNEGGINCYLLGAIIRNDPAALPTSLVGIQLVAWTYTNLEDYLIYDLLVIPPDLEVALGTVDSPITEFSNKPRSVRIKTRLELGAGGFTNGNSTASAMIVSMPRSRLLQRVADLKEMENVNYYRSYNLIGYDTPPPHP